MSQRKSTEVNESQQKSLRVNRGLLLSLRSSLSPMPLPSITSEIRSDLLVTYYTDFGKIDERRQFFEEYAEKAGFDPLVPENWYQQSKDIIRSGKVFHFLCFYLFPLV